MIDVEQPAEDLSSGIDHFYDVNELTQETSLFPAATKTQTHAPGPGNIRTKGKFTVHTKAAHRLFFGRKKAPGIESIIGLVQFSSKVNLIYTAAENDDPYAAKKLIEIEAGLAQVMVILKEKEEYLNELLGQDDNIEIYPSLSVQPETLEIEFRTPYGYLGVRLLSAFDRVLLKALAARHAALLFDEDWKQCINIAARKVRHVFSLAAGYHYTGVNREDLVAKNKKGLLAIEKYGELPQSVLDGQQRAKHAPKIKQKTSIAKA